MTGGSGTLLAPKASVIVVSSNDAGVATIRFSTTSTSDGGTAMVASNVADVARRRRPLVKAPRPMVTWLDATPNAVARPCSSDVWTDGMLNLSSVMPFKVSVALTFSVYVANSMGEGSATDGGAVANGVGMTGASSRSAGANGSRFGRTGASVSRSPVGRTPGSPGSGMSGTTGIGAPMTTGAIGANGSTGRTATGTTDSMGGGSASDGGAVAGVGMTGASSRSAGASGSRFGTSAAISVGAWVVETITGIGAEITTGGAPGGSVGDTMGAKVSAPGIRSPMISSMVAKGGSSNWASTENWATTHASRTPSVQFHRKCLAML
jgi:hypothetical protein